MNDRREPTAPDLVRGGVTVPGSERQRCSIWTRIMGYYRPKDAANPGKQSEIADRKMFRELAEFVSREQERLEV